MPTHTPRYNGHDDHPPHDPPGNGTPPPPPDAPSTPCAKRPRTEAQRGAARRNGARGRSPDTKAGKLRSRRNALKSGIFSEDPAVWARSRPDKQRLAATLRQLRRQYTAATESPKPLFAMELQRLAKDLVTLDRYHRIRDALLDGGGSTEAAHARAVAQLEQRGRGYRHLLRVAEALRSGADEPVDQPDDKRFGGCRVLARFILKQAAREAQRDSCGDHAPVGRRFTFEGLDLPDAETLTDLLAGVSSGSTVDGSAALRRSLLDTACHQIRQHRTRAERQLSEALDARELSDLALAEQLPTLDTVERQITRVTRRADRLRERLDQTADRTDAETDTLPRPVLDRPERMTPGSA